MNDKNLAKKKLPMRNKNDKKKCPQNYLVRTILILIILNLDRNDSTS